MKVRLFEDRHIGQWIRKCYVLIAIEVLNLDMSEKRTLDAGCGYGDYLLYLASKFGSAQFEGLECDASKIVAIENKLKLLDIKNAVVFKGDLAFSFGENLYDFIYSVDVLEHIEDDRSAFKNIFNALKSDGLFLIHVPLCSQRFYLRSSYVTEPDHVRPGYVEEDLLAKIKNTGFLMVKKTYTFSWAGTIAWELMKLTENSHRFIKFMLRLVAPILIKTEMFNKHAKGNCILILAQKPRLPIRNDDKQNGRT